MRVMKARVRLVALVVAVAAVAAAASCGASGASLGPGDRERGKASWYGEPFHGRPTANGEIYDMHAISAAHRTLPLGTRLAVRNLENGRSIEVRINDRGPFVGQRILDLSRAAASELGMLQRGVAEVEITVLEVPPRHTWRVQVGAFRSPANAELTHGRAQRIEPEMRLWTEGELHRVQRRGITSHGEARRLRKKLRRAGFDAVILRERR